MVVGSSRSLANLFAEGKKSCLSSGPAGQGATDSRSRTERGKSGCLGSRRARGRWLSFPAVSWWRMEAAASRASGQPCLKLQLRWPLSPRASERSGGPTAKVPKKPFSPPGRNSCGTALLATVVTLTRSISPLVPLPKTLLSAAAAGRRATVSTKCITAARQATTPKTL